MGQRLSFPDGVKCAGLPTCWVLILFSLAWLQFQKRNPIAKEHSRILKLSQRLKIWKDVQKDYGQEVDVLKAQEGYPVSFSHI